MGLSRLLLEHLEKLLDEDAVRGNLHAGDLREIDALLTLPILVDYPPALVPGNSTASRPSRSVRFSVPL